MRNDNDKFYRIVESMLYDYMKLKVEIKNIDLDIEEEQNNYSTLSAVQYDKDSISKTYKFNSEVENQVIKVDKDGTSDIIKALLAKKRSKEIQVERIDNALSLLNETEYKLIEMRYFKGMQFKDIADVLYKSDIYLIQLRRKTIRDKLVPLLIN